MTTTVLKISQGRPRAEPVLAALQKAGIGVVEVDSWESAANALSECETALVVCDGELLDADSDILTNAITSLASRRKARSSIPAEVARAVSHDLRTPLSAMSGWLHLMESGTLDDAGLKRAIEKLRGNLDDQIRVIERHFGVSNNAGS